MGDLAAEGEGVRDVMTKNVVTAEPLASVRDAALLMSERKCSCLVIVRGNVIVGIVTERDLVRKVIAVGLDPSKAAVRAVMSSPVITIGEEETVAEAAQKMSDYLIRRLAVVDNAGILVGLITANDIAKLLSKKKSYSDPGLNAIARIRGP